ncbi:sensor domain-containing protein [Mycobacterium malmoense]|uniref:sensor domain-containing protein n=1 Tax=Mycobacterium malmoense TaxID=1780 RepID=UPI001C38F5B4|nr:sensor domain-containing protein [Mycobacterium malmoense]QZA16180.1 sensor domain-containing protein [Mycobacterium malmoense]UNB92990.1 sensor domain-containing protein [Mycobacterium malmoense]
MKTIGAFVPLLAAVTLAAGCAVAVGGTARPTADSTPRPLTGQTIKRVLLGEGVLSRILKQSFEVDHRFPPRFGGPDQLQNDGPALPVDCLGVAEMLQQSVYQSANVSQVAVETWRHVARSVEVTGVREGVVSLPTAADAKALFAEFSRQWQKCDGTTLPLPGSVFRLEAKATNIQAAASVLGATVSMRFTVSGSDSPSIPAGRAIGVRDNCLVEVEVDFFNTSNPSPQRSGDINSSAIDIAHAMMDEVSALS